MILDFVEGVTSICSSRRVSFFNSISMEVDGREESGNCSRMGRVERESKAYLPSLPSVTNTLWAPRHRKLHAADNFARRGRYIGVITIITLSVFSAVIFRRTLWVSLVIFSSSFFFFFVSRHENRYLSSLRPSPGKIFVRKTKVGNWIGALPPLRVPFVSLSTIETRVVDFTRYDRSSVRGMWKKAR